MGGPGSGRRPGKLTNRRSNYQGESNIHGRGGLIGKGFKPRTSQGKSRPRTKGRY